MSTFNSIYPPATHTPREVRDAGVVGGKTNARYQSARRLRVPPATAAAGLAIHPKGPVDGKRTRQRTRRKVERAAKERYISTYCRLVHSTALRLCTAAWLARARGRVQRASHGRSGRVGRARRRRKEFQGALERNGRKGPRGQTDQREIQRMRSLHSNTTPYYEEKGGGVRSHNS
jgi:hypothetical protein